MTVTLTEGEKTVTGGNGIEVTSNKVVNLILRNLNNLIKINNNNEVYTDLQLADGLDDDAVMPVGVNVGRVLQADGWLANGTLLDAKTTSGDEIRFLFADNGKLYTDNGTGTFTQIYLKPEVDALFTQLRGELSAVAFSGEYNDLLHKPVLGTAASKDVGTSAGNVPEIGQDGKLPSSILPAMAMHAFTVSTKNDLITLSDAVAGDIGFVEDVNQSYILVREPYSTLANWQEYSAVNSVNGYRGVVTLTTNDIPVEGTTNLYVSSNEKNTWNAKLGTNDVATVALTGSYSNLSNKPTIPDAQIQSDWTQNNQSAVDYIKNKPTVDSAMSDSSTNAVQNKVIKAYVDTTAGSSASAKVSDEAYGSTWDGVTGVAPSKNAVYDKINTIEGSITSLGTNKQDTLVSGTNIKTINNESLLGSGNIDLSSVITTASTFGEFINACKAYGSRHQTSTSAYTNYTFQGIGYMSIDWFYNCVVKINGETVVYVDYSSGERGGFGPITFGPGDKVEATPLYSGQSAHFDGFIADYY